MSRDGSEPLRSVDNALRLLHLLRDQGRLGVGEAAAALEISTSASHRLLTGLVRRGFALQNGSRLYLPGPALTLPAGGHPLLSLRDAVLPDMLRSVSHVGETLSLGVLIGTVWRVVAAVESTRRLRVSDQEGAVLPAHLTAGGRAALSQFDDATVLEKFRTEGEGRATAAQLRRLMLDLQRVRDQGVAVNHGEAEEGISAVAVPLRALGTTTPTALAAVLPSTRFSAERSDALRRALADIVQAAAPALERVARVADSTWRERTG